MASLRSWPLSKGLAEVKEGTYRSLRTSSSTALRREHIRHAGAAADGRGRGRRGGRGAAGARPRQALGASVRTSASSVHEVGALAARPERTGMI